MVVVVVMVQAAVAVATDVGSVVVVIILVAVAVAVLMMVAATADDKWLLSRPFVSPPRLHFGRRAPLARAGLWQLRSPSRNGGRAACLPNQRLQRQKLC